MHGDMYVGSAHSPFDGSGNWAACMYTHIHIYIYIHIIYVYIYIYIYMYVCMYVCMYVMCIHACMCILYNSRRLARGSSPVLGRCQPVCAVQTHSSPA